MRFIHDKDRKKMVRVISCHHFQSQDVFTVENEPVALATANDLLLVATLQHCIEVWDLQSPGKVLHTFPTVDQAKQMAYCNKGDYVATLEVRASRQAVMSFVRIYLNWQVDTKGQPMRARIAGRVTPSSQSSANVLEMVELPLKKQAFCITCCYETGNLAIGLGDTVSIFRFCMKTHDISRRAFCDLEHMLDVTLTLSAHHLALCEDVLACLSPNELHVIQIKVFSQEGECYRRSPRKVPTIASNTAEPLLPIPLNEEQNIVKDDNFVQWDFDAVTADMCSIPSQQAWREDARQKLHPDSWPLVIYLPGLIKADKLDMQQQDTREILGPSEAVNVQLQAYGVQDYSVTAITLLYRHFLLDQEISSGLHSLHLLPLFSADGTEIDPSLEDCNFLFSKHSGERCSLSCFFSSPQQGYLYSISNKTHLLATYPYTSSARAVTLEMNLLHAVTEAGLETYTLKTNCQVAEEEDNVVPTFPEDPVCLVGLQAFLNIEQLILSHSRLVLLSAAIDELSSSQDSDTGNWTLYSLTRSTPVEFYHDMLEVANAHREKSPATYIHLLHEAHSILRGNIITYSNPDPVLSKIYQESCCLMGDFYLMSEISEENKLAVAFYRMSHCPIGDVITRVLQLWAQVHPMPLPVKGLIEYLNHHLLDGKLKADINQPMADTILDLYADNEPVKLSKVITRGLSNYSQDKALMLLKKRILSKKGSSDDIVALAWLYVDQKQTDQISLLFSTLPKERLINSLLQHYWLWMSEGRFSTFAQLIRQWRPDIFVEVSLQLVFNQNFLVADFVVAFQESKLETPLQKIPHFKEFLEALLTSSRIDVWESEAPVYLAKIYLLRMMEGPKGKQSQPLLRAMNLFGIRAMWLNTLPPFEGRSLRDPCLGKQNGKGEAVPCPCWECNEELLRLQSLECHELCPSTAKALVLKEVLANADAIVGSLSLQVLSVESTNQIISLLADAHPLALIHYGKEDFTDSLEKWQLVRDTLITRLKKTTPTTPQCNALNQAVQMLLSHLAEIFPPATFLTLLPPGEASTYLPYVRRCCHKHQAQLLKEKIIAKGLELKAAV